MTDSAGSEREAFGARGQRCAHRAGGLPSAAPSGRQRRGDLGPAGREGGAQAAGLAWAHLVTGRDGTAGGRTAFSAHAYASAAPGAGTWTASRRAPDGTCGAVTFSFCKMFPRQTKGRGAKTRKPRDGTHSGRTMKDSSAPTNPSSPGRPRGRNRGTEGHVGVPDSKGGWRSRGAGAAPRDNHDLQLRASCSPSRGP